MKAEAQLVESTLNRITDEVRAYSRMPGAAERHVLSAATKAVGAFAKECSYACIRGASLDLFNRSTEVYRIVIAACWYEAETDDMPNIHITPYDEAGNPVESLLVRASELASDTESFIWGILSQYEIESYFKETSVYRDGKIEPSFDHSHSRRPD